MHQTIFTLSPDDQIWEELNNISQDIKEGPTVVTLHRLAIIISAIIVYNKPLLSSKIEKLIGAKTSELRLLRAVPKVKTISREDKH